jgi:hypothetical protein
MVDPRRLERPHIFGQRLPEPGERSTADHLNLLTFSLENHVNGFQTALRLFDHCTDLHNALMATPDHVFDRHRDYQSWVFIAARAATLDIYHFGISLASLRNRAGLCPTLRPHFNNDALHLVERSFEAKFPGADRMRHAIGHAAEMLRTPEFFDDNFRIEKTGFLISEIRHRSFVLTHEGTVFTVEISSATLETLQSLLARTFDVLRPMAAAAWTYEPARPSRPQPDQPGRL